MGIVMRPCGLILTLCSIGISAYGQLLSTATLSGAWFVRHVQFTTGPANAVTDARSLNGTITFNGAGNYSFTGQQVTGTGSAASFSVSGNYSLTGGGNVTLTNPQKASLNLNARYSAEALVGSSTEATDNTFDLFVAIPAPASGQNNASAGGTWNAADFELTAASTAQVRDSAVTLAMDGAGNVSSLSLTGRAANFAGGTAVSQSVNGATYNIASDGSGTLGVPAPAGISGAGVMLGTTARTLYVSRSGRILIAGTPGAHDLFVAVRAGGPAVTLTSGQRFWNAGLRIDSSGSAAGYAGSTTVIASSGLFNSTRRLHETGAALNVTQSAAYTLAPDGTGSSGAGKIAVQSGILTLATTGAALDPTGYEIGIGVPLPAVSGSGVFVNPQGIVNAATNAPAGDFIAPGEFLAIYGSGLAASPAGASALPFPLSLGGVSVSIGGKSAPLFSVSSGQINCIVPYGVTGATANITVTNGTASNTVTVGVAPTAPGVFSADTSGTGDGAITHADGSIVNASSPAIKGETVVMYMSGLGALTNPVNDGFGATGINNAVTQLAVYVNGVAVPAADIAYQGLTVDAGLYQINFKVPSSLKVSGELPVAVLTPDGFTDEVSIAVQ
jgi:uncharacterized protein (TIGR03437 family)